MNEATSRRPAFKWRWLRMVANGLVCIAVLGAAVYAVKLIYEWEPTAEKLNATRKSAALVETVAVERGTYSPRLVVLGTVEAARDIFLSPRVSGQVIEMSPDFVPGGMVKEGDLLLRIDPADFENAVSIRESELKQIEASMEIEEARQRLAEKELELLGDSITDTNRSLVLREPQIASIKAEVAAAEASLQRARLDLERTRVNAPFDAQVLNQNVNIGSQVGPGDQLARLVGMKEYWVRAAVPIRSLRWIEFEDDMVSTDETGKQDESKEDTEPAAPAADGNERAAGEEDNGVPTSEESEDETGEVKAGEAAEPDGGSRVILRNPDAWGPGVEREARVSRMIGTLDQETRLARILVTVNDPLGLQSDVPRLILDTLIETEIEGRPIEGVVRLAREYVRDQDTVWVMKDNKLEIRDVEIVFRDPDYAYISKGLETGDEVVTTTLATVAEGVGLRKVGGRDDEDATDREESMK